MTTPAIFQYAKTIAALIGAVLTSVSAVLPVVPLWLTVVLAVATAIAVFVVPNAATPEQKQRVLNEAFVNGEVIPTY